MKKILFLFATFIFTADCSGAEVSATQAAHSHLITDLDEFATAWAQAAVNDLCQEELELLGTFLYYDVAVSQYELALRNALLDLQRSTEILSFKIINQTESEKAIVFCSQLNTLLEKIEKDLAPSRNYFLAAWEICNNEINQSQHKTITVVVEQLQKMGQRALNNWAATNKNEIAKILENSGHLIDESIKQMNFYKNVLQELVDGTFPVSEETEFVEIQTVHNALSVSHALYENLFKASLATDEVMSISFGLINLNMIIFGKLYEAFYNALETKNLVPMHIVIDGQGYIPAESRSNVLPKFTQSTEPAE